MRWAARQDENQPEIVAALESIGCSVLSLQRVGKGCPDLLVGYRQCNVLMEIKQLKGKLNQKQEEFHAEWRGNICVVRTPEEAIRVMTRG
jgi:hypothetical protein